MCFKQYYFYIFTLKIPLMYSMWENDIIYSYLFKNDKKMIVVNNKFINYRPIMMRMHFMG